MAPFCTLCTYAFLVIKVSVTISQREQVGFRTLHGYKPLPHVLESIPLETVEGYCTDESMGRISKDLA